MPGLAGLTLICTARGRRRGLGEHLGAQLGHGAGDLGKFGLQPVQLGEQGSMIGAVFGGPFPPAHAVVVPLCVLVMARLADPASGAAPGET
jgi:hypothetical protein